MLFSSGLDEVSQRGVLLLACTFRKYINHLKKINILKDLLSRAQMLQTEEGLDFLHCNAFFLLGVASDIKPILNVEDRDRTDPPSGLKRPAEPFAVR